MAEVDRLREYRRDHLSFDVTDIGRRDGPAVIALHGFPSDRHCWDALGHDLAESGRRVLAPDQRGYSPGARPRSRRAYVLDELVADVLALADAAGADRFDVVGHDFGALVAWGLAARHPGRVRTVTALSVPHPAAFADAARRSTQLLHSWYMLAFQLPTLPEVVLRTAGLGRVTEGLERDGLDAGSAARYAARLADPAQARSMIGWYRALPLDLRRPLPAVTRPALFVWGDRDHYVTRCAAERNHLYMDGPYRHQVLVGEGHWLPERSPAQIALLLGDHLSDAE